MTSKYLILVAGYMKNNASSFSFQKRFVTWKSWTLTWNQVRHCEPKWTSCVVASRLVVLNLQFALCCLPPISQRRHPHQRHVWLSCLSDLFCQLQQFQITSLTAMCDVVSFSAYFLCGWKVLPRHLLCHFQHDRLSSNIFKVHCRLKMA